MREIIKINELMERFKCNTVEKLNMLNLDFETLLYLFDLTDTVITMQDVRHAKNITNKLHPDKSRLDPIYFIFYKRAFEILRNLHNDTNKYTITPNEENTQYNLDEDDITLQNDFVKELPQEITIELFNKFFEENFTKQINVNKNNWFSDTDDRPLNYQESLGINKNISNQKIDQSIRRSNVTDIIEHKEIKSYYQDSGEKLFNSDGDSSEYLSSNSSSLLYDDIRRVHRDESVFTVDSTDYIEDTLTENEINEIRNSIVCPMNEVDSENYFKESDNIRIDIYNRDKIQDIRNSNANTTISNIFKSQFRKLLS